MQKKLKIKIQLILLSLGGLLEARKLIVCQIGWLTNELGLVEKVVQGWLGGSGGTEMGAVCGVCRVGAEYVAFAGSSWVSLELEGPGCLVGWEMWH